MSYDIVDSEGVLSMLHLYSGAVADTRMCRRPLLHEALPPQAYRTIFRDDARYWKSLIACESRSGRDDLCGTPSRPLKRVISPDGQWLVPQQPAGCRRVFVVHTPFEFRHVFW